MDIKEAVEKVLASVKADPAKIETFLKSGESEVKKILGDGKLSAEDLQAVVKEVTAKLSSEGGNVLDKVKDLFK